MKENPKRHNTELKFEYERFKNQIQIWIINTDLKHPKLKIEVDLIPASSLFLSHLISLVKTASLNPKN